MNRIEVTGNLTNDVTVTTVGEKNTLKGSFSMAVNRKYASGQDNDYFNCEVFGTIAETHAKNIKKGSKVLVAGEMHIDRGTDNTKIYPKIVVSDIEYLDAKE